MAEYQRSISDTDVQIGNGDPLSMKRQLQISFANLEESENAFQVKVKYMELKVVFINKQIRNLSNRYLRLFKTLLIENLMN